MPEARKMVVRKIFDVSDVIDEAMVVWFEKGSSFTSEDVLEIHAHGGRATVSGVLSLLGRFPRTRPAEPGEFTRRALESGKLNLLEVEALADLINSETEEQRKQALSLMVGDGSQQAREWRDLFLHALALLEASIDFSDEEDAPEDVTTAVSDLLAKLSRELVDVINGARSAARIREGFRIALVGSPNAGKSSLINALAKKNAAITSPYAGTTRDIIEVACDFDGYAVVLQDMAGIRETSDPVETIGVAWARETAASADLRLFLSSLDVDGKEWDDLFKPGDIAVSTKADLFPDQPGLSISSKTGVGLKELLAEIISQISGKDVVSSAFARDRQVECLREAYEQIQRCKEERQPELMVEHLRGGVYAMNELFGVIGTEEILGQIFSQFCIGK